MLELGRQRDEGAILHVDAIEAAEHLRPPCFTASHFGHGFLQNGSQQGHRGLAKTLLDGLGAHSCSQAGRHMPHLAIACLRLIHPAEDHHLRKGRSIQDRAAALRHPPVSRSISLARCCNTRFIASLTCGLLLISFLLLVLDVHSFLESITSGVVFALLGFLAGDLVDEPCINLAPQADLCLLLAS